MSGIILNYCPFCGADIGSHLAPAARRQLIAGDGIDQEEAAALLQAKALLASAVEQGGLAA